MRAFYSLVEVTFESYVTTTSYHNMNIYPLSVITGCFSGVIGSMPPIFLCLHLSPLLFLPLLFIIILLNNRRSYYV